MSEPRGHALVRVLISMIVVVGAGCDGSPGDGAAAPGSTPSPSPAATEAPVATSTPQPGRANPGMSLDDVFAPVPGYRFRDYALPETIRSRIEDAFKTLRPIEVTAKRVETSDGAPVPVRVLAVSFNTPAEISLADVAYEIGRDFLGATPQNSSQALGGRAVYMRPQTEGGSEAMAFFAESNLFVYAFGLSSAAPTERIARALLR